MPVFRRALADIGFIGGGNVANEFRWADGEYERLPGIRYAEEMALARIATGLTTNMHDHLSHQRT